MGHPQGGVAESADAGDLKSPGPRPSGFESRLPHHANPREQPIHGITAFLQSRLDYLAIEDCLVPLPEHLRVPHGGTR